ncbi:pDP93R [African swine fever virus]|nr:putative protein pKP93L [African swine fever virus]QZK26869.1 putative protein pDP93R [African swine fever virus]WNL53091.1 pKP93L [African swine fever virus]WNL53261.1 pDP93R [African swine fever virus]
MFFFGIFRCNMDDHWTTKRQVYIYLCFSLMTIALICYLIHICCHTKKNVVTNALPSNNMALIPYTPSNNTVPPPYTISGSCPQ